MSSRAILVDFDGVLCPDYFYSNQSFPGLKVTHSQVYEFVQTRIFGQDSARVKRWMRGELSSREINQWISQQTGIEFEILWQAFLESVRHQRVDVRLTGLVEELKESGIPVALVTDNMDVFCEITIDNHRLREIFPVIVCSSQCGVLKKEREGLLFRKALEGLGINSFEGVLLIDDSLSNKAYFETLGGQAFTYQDFETFEPWARKNLLWPRVNRERGY
ncbi:MAG: HAD hydrolase-like protein [Patescibacteria group bacterium]|nr:HAD hydrolase-like protein [Patescibacteria group bacterium]